MLLLTGGLPAQLPLSSGGIMWRFRRHETIMNSESTTPGQWKPDELNLRNREVAAAEAATKSQNWVQIIQALSVMVALASTVIALYSARQSANSARQSSAAANAAAQMSQEQSDEGRLSSAISALDAGRVSARVTRMLLIQRDIQGIMSLPLSTDAARQNAYNDYATVLSVFSVYLKNHVPRATRKFGPGYGIPATNQMPRDVISAAGEIRELLSMQSQAAALAPHLAHRLVIDLSNVDLYGQIWPDIDFSRILLYMPQSDLRGAYLADSRWNGATLFGSSLQCANLSGADLRGANLESADLQGADVQGANFQGASLKGANLRNLYGSAIGLPTHRATSGGIPDTFNCLRNSSFWTYPIQVSNPQP
jgi:hypothetical protein